MEKDVVLTDIDNATVLGRVNIEAKAETLRVFFKNSLRSSLNLRILCCMSGVGNAGINSPDITTVYRIDFPPSVLDIFRKEAMLAGVLAHRLKPIPIRYVSYWKFFYIFSNA